MRTPGPVEGRFAALFAEVDIDQVLDFLDGTTHVAQDARIAAVLPVRRFLRAAARTPWHVHAPRAA